MNGNDRRRMEISHPELFPTTEEKANRKEIVKDILGIVNGISIFFMLFGMIVVAFISTRYMGYSGLFIAFFGILLDVILGALIAYNLGNKIQKYYTEKYLNNKAVY